jgi:RNA polymerase sigma-70 factor (ECF subfamily)
MGHEPESPDYERLPDMELWERNCAKDPRAYAELWSRWRTELSREAIRLARGDEARAGVALYETRDRLGRSEFQKAYSAEVPWIEFARMLMRGVIADLDCQELPEEDLQRRYHEGDPGAIGALFVRHWPTLKMMAWKASYGDEEVQDEILFETQAKLKGPPAYTSYDLRPWLPWVRSVLKRVAIDLHRKRSRAGNPPVRLDLNLLPAPVHLDLETLWRDLDECLKSLPQDERNLIELYFLEEVNWSEAARTLGKYPSWANRVCPRALRKLRNCLERKGYSDED